MCCTLRLMLALLNLGVSASGTSLFDLLPMEPTDWAASEYCAPQQVDRHKLKKINIPYTKTKNFLTTTGGFM